MLGRSTCAFSCCWTRRISEIAGGLPPFSRTISCCLAKATGAGGGAILATTGRLIIGLGGLTRATMPAPTTLRCCGATVGVIGATGAEATSLAFTRIMLLCTDPAETKVSCEVAVTAFTCVRF